MKGLRDLLYAIFGPPPGRLVTGVLTKNAKLGQHGREQGHVNYFFKFWNHSKTVSQTIRKQITLRPNVQAGVRKPLGLFAPL